MQLNEEELLLPAEHGARLVALRMLDDVSDAATRLHGARDDESLHDFRVAVRRLRSWLRAFEPELHGALRGKDRKRLKHIAEATNPGRDLEVQLEWLGTAGSRINFRRRRGVRWMHEYLALRRRSADAELDAVANTEFPAVRDTLATSLSSYVQVVHRNATAISASLSAAIGVKLATQADAVGDALDDVHTVKDDASAHAARIAAKRARYLIEPLNAHKDIKKILKPLKRLQDDLGALHDAHVMGDELRGILAQAEGMNLPSASASQLREVPHSAIQSVLKRLTKDLEEAFRTVDDTWLRGRHGELLDDLRACAKQLRRGTLS